MKLGEHRFKKWLVTCLCEAIAWTNVDLSDLNVLSKPNVWQGAYLQEITEMEL